MDNKKKYELARKRAEAKLGFFIHAAVYAAVNLVLMAIDLATSPGKIWFIWPMIGWGIGVIGHGLLVYRTPQSTGFMDRLIKKELKKIE